LAREAVESGALPEEHLVELGGAEFVGSFQSRSPLTQPDIGKIENLHAVFGFVVEFPIVFPIARFLCRWTVLGPAFRIFYRGYLKRILRMRRRRDAY
jgi:hypothetical protein